MPSTSRRPSWYAQTHKLFIHTIIINGKEHVVGIARGIISLRSLRASLHSRTLPILNNSKQHRSACSNHKPRRCPLVSLELPLTRTPPLPVSHAHMSRPHAHVTDGLCEPYNQQVLLSLVGWLSGWCDTLSFQWWLMILLGHLLPKMSILISKSPIRVQHYVNLAHWT